MKKLLLFFALLFAALTFAQTASPPVYEFLKVAVTQNQQESFAKLLFAPTFQDKTEVVG